MGVREVFLLKAYTVVQVNGADLAVTSEIAT